jgi:hypothetical protein
MNRCYLAFYACLTLGPVSLLAQQKPPTIAFDSLTKDFGSVIEGQTLKHVFKFSNNGGSLLHIIRAEGS